MDHVSLEVTKAEDLEYIYIAATARGSQATAPRIYGGYYQTFVFDPDGYKIEIVSTDVPESPLDGRRRELVRHAARLRTPTSGATATRSTTEASPHDAN
jgi:hypothetical protein